MPACTVTEVPFPVGIKPSKSNLKLEMCAEEESTLRLVTCLLHFMAQYTNREKLTDSAMRNVTVAFVFIADITSQSDDQFQEKVVQEIAMVPGICRILLENICHSGKPIQLSVCGNAMKLKQKKTTCIVTSSCYTCCFPCICFYNFR